ncbi:cob(I)yrinic acid a,c-diamide adenosyltransferase [Thermodesulfovibrionales bacterium]|nr:cob(I)yrinic acid a,c-diamide adenosyltransferase [Thermodesulfovibrionales bacterium]MCL0085583.1 cob(I)yrinic acid a,c-diamide adenosyltransferase [Thermodesulfovibrionales bacterium]
MSEKKSLVMVYTGDGKGKTTASLGLALRTLGHGAKVAMVQFMKGRTYGELIAAKNLPNFEIIMSGRDEFVSKEDPEEIDIKMAQEGFTKAQECINSGRYDMVILDEINVALDYELVSVPEVLNLIKNRPKHVDLVLTGRYVPAAIIEIADLVSEVQEIKHHYQKGVEARQGIEF